MLSRIRTRSVWGLPCLCEVSPALALAFLYVFLYNEISYTTYNFEDIIIQMCIFCLYNVRFTIMMDPHMERQSVSKHGSPSKPMTVARLRRRLPCHMTAPPLAEVHIHFKIQTLFTFSRYAPTFSHICFCLQRCTEHGISNRPP